MANGDSPVSTTWGGPAAARQHGTQAVDRAARLLTAVADAGEPVSFTWLCSESGLARSTVSRLMLALERNRLVRRDEAGRFLPGEIFESHAGPQLTSQSTRAGGDWVPVWPGLEARLRPAFAADAPPAAWIDVRPETRQP